MSFPRVDTGIREMANDALLQTDMARAIVRKSGIFLGALGAGSPPDSWQSFTLVNHSTLGYVQSYVPSAQSPFPSDYPMDKFSDWTGISQARLLVTVTQAGASGTYLAVRSEDALFEPSGLIVPLDAVGVQISEWQTVDRVDGDGLFTEWIVDNPALLDTGTFAVGFCQIQAI